MLRASFRVSGEDGKGQAAPFDKLRAGFRYAAEPVPSNVEGPLLRVRGGC